MAVYVAVQAQPEVDKELARGDAMGQSFRIETQDEFRGTGEPPRTIDGWKGKRVRAHGGLGEAMRLLGAVPTSVPAPEVYTALERGVFEAASFPFTYSFGSYKL